MARSRTRVLIFRSKTAIKTLFNHAVTDKIKFKICCDCEENEGGQEEIRLGCDISSSQAGLRQQGEEKGGGP